MRNASMLLLVPAVLALAGFARPQAAHTPLTVNSVTCQTFTTWRFSCVADVSGGTGVYNIYEWDWPQAYNGPGGETTYWNEVYAHCGGGDGFVLLTLTVTDSNWNTAQGNVGFYCSYYG